METRVCLDQILVCTHVLMWCLVVEEIEVEKLHISPEMAQRDILEDARDGVASPLSPMSDEDGKITDGILHSLNKFYRIIWRFFI